MFKASLQNSKIAWVSSFASQNMLTYLYHGNMKNHYHRFEMR